MGLFVSTQIDHSYVTLKKRKKNITSASFFVSFITSVSVLTDKCTKVASGLTNVAGITASASTCVFINDTITETLRQGIFHALPYSFLD